MHLKSQSSFEFLVIFGIGLTLIAVLSGIFFSYSNSAESNLNRIQIEKIGKEIISNVEKIYFLGSGNKITYKANFPSGISNITIVHMNNSNSTTKILFDYLNITYYNNGNLTSSIFTANQNYIRFNCSKCYNGPIVNGSWISYYNDTSDITGGTKTIEIYSEGNYVNIDFVK